MSEKISALMDGELELHEQRGQYPELALEGEAREAWRSYHVTRDVLRDALRDTPLLSAGFSARLAARLALEPTVLAPRERQVDARVRWRAMSVAASIAAVALVGWMWFAPQGGVQRSAEVALAPAKPPAAVAEAPAPKVPLPNGAGDYLLAHQGYSPRGNLQGVAPYVRTVSESVRRR